MPLPGDVPKVVVTYGAQVDASNVAITSGTMMITPQMERTHLASGTYVDRRPIMVEIEDGVGTSEPVIASDAPGFNVEGQVLYDIAFRNLKDASGTRIARSGLVGVSLPLAVPTVDVDNLTVSAQPGATVIYPSVLTIAELGGVVTGGQLLAALGLEGVTTDLANVATAIAAEITNRNVAITDAIEALLGGATPAALDTLTELADALGDDPNFASTITTLIGSKQASSTRDHDVATDLEDRESESAGAVTTLAKEVGDARYLRTAVATVVDLGNSIASQGTLSYYDRISSGALSFGPVSYMGWAMPKTFGRFRLKGVAAAGGYTMEQIIAELLEDAIDANPDFVHLQVFTNNLAPIIAGTQTFAQAQALYMQIVDAIVAAGIIPIIATVPPITTVTNTGTGLTVLTKVNLWLKRLAGANGWPLVDYHGVLVNAADNNLTAAYTVDGVHMSGAGAKVMGEALAATLNSIPTKGRSPLWGSYNPNLMQPDCVMTSAAADKWVGSGNTGGSWVFKSVEGPMWKGKSYIITRGSVADYAINAPITAGLWVAGHRIRVSFQFDATLVPASGTWSIGLWNATQSQYICGYAGMTDVLTHKSLTVLNCTTTSGSKVVSGAPAGTWKPEHVGCGLSSVGSIGLLAAFPANTVVTNVSADGTTLYASNNATDSRTSACVTVSGPQPVVIFEFDVDADMVGDTIYPVATVAGAAGVTLNPSQVTIQDITALGVEAA